MSYSRRQLEALWEPFGNSCTRMEGGRMIYGGGGGGNDSPPSQTTTISKSEPPDWVKDQSINVMNRAQALSETPYTPYTGQTIAGVDPATTQGLNSIQARATAGNPLTPAAQNFLTGTINGTNANPYAGPNPYLENVINRTMGDVSSRVNSQFNGSNYGTTAHQETLGRSLADTQAGMRMQDYTAQQQLGESAMNRRMAATQMAPNIANMDYADMSKLLQVGDANRMLNQEVLNDEYRKWQEAQQDPYRKLDILSAGVSTAGGGYATTQQTAPNQYKTSNVSNLLGGGLLGMGAYQSGLFG